MSLNPFRRHRDVPALPESPVIAEDAYWRSVARWDASSLDASHFAHLLGVSEAAVRQYRGRDRAFPEPAATGRRNTWSQTQAYTYLADHRPKLRHRIPRLYHLGADLAPARFVAAEVHKLLSTNGEPRTWVVHIWQPADDRGTVAVAYTEEGVTVSGARECAPRLLSALTSVSAVAVPTEEWCVLMGEADNRFQDEIVVAERRVGLGKDTAVAVDNYGWFDLAALLRVNLPWWPVGLRDPEAVRVWRPGTPPQALRPRARFFNEDTLKKLLTEATDQKAAQRSAVTVDTINARIESLIYTDQDTPDVPGSVERPGLFQAAYPRYRTTTVRELPLLFEILDLLKLEIPNESVRDQAYELLCGRDEVRSAVGRTVEVSESDGPLAREWIARLTKCDDDRSLGSLFALRSFTREQMAQPAQWWQDPASMFGWIAQSHDGVFHATVGTRTPATGTLSEFEVEAGWSASFFRAGGKVWPMPLGGNGYYTCGYRGTGSDNLINAVARLYEAADIELPSQSNLSKAPRALRALIRTREAPLLVEAAQLAAIMGAAEQTI